ncbi:MAG: hypothetical protein PHV35_02085 [Mariniphaga sp.]|nr:hypothetical protein [Mariniphaga sp.]
MDKFKTVSKFEELMVRRNKPTFNNYMNNLKIILLSFFILYAADHFAHGNRVKEIRGDEPRDQADSRDPASVKNPELIDPPVLLDTANLGRYTSRTLNLLKNSDPQNPNEVKILVYGQSISEQEWWLHIKEYVKDQYPHANIVMENKAIGGFASQLLCKTVEMDVCSFYPDLVLLHIYGDVACYDSVLYTIRSRTAAEVVITNDHYTEENDWSDTMSYHLLPSLAEKYKCDLINIRDPWKKYLKDNNLEPAKLLKDGVHLNDDGNLVMAELIKPVFTFRQHHPPDPFGLCTIYREGRDFTFRGKTLTLSFTGNRAVAVIENEKSGTIRPLEISVDGEPPTAHPGTHYMTRPYNDTGRYWPWQLPAMIRVRHHVPWLNEEWTLTFSKVVPPYTDFQFSVEGSVTGKDGNGTSLHDFVSPSGRVIIAGGDSENGGDWHLNRSYKVSKAEVHPGDIVKWRTYSIGMDFYPPDQAPVKSGTDYPVLFQGIPNTNHLLKIKKTGKYKSKIKEIRIYKPFLSARE